MHTHAHMCMNIIYTYIYIYMCVCVCAQVCVCVLYQQQSVYCLLQRLTSKHAMLDLFCKLSLTKLQFSLPVLVCVLGKVAAFEGSPRWNSPTDAHTRRHGHRDGHAHTVSEEAETDGDEAKDTAPKRTTHGLPAPRIAVAVSGLTAGTVTSPPIAPVPIPVSVPFSGAIPIPIPSVFTFSQNDFTTFIAPGKGARAIPSRARSTFPAIPIPGSLSIAAAAASLGRLTNKRRGQIVDLGLELLQLHGAQCHRYIGTACGIAGCLSVCRHQDAECDCR